MNPQKKHKAALIGKEELTSELLYKLYKPYGYEIHTLSDIERLESLVKTYDNNTFALVPYINERTMEIVIEQEYQHLMFNFPRQWKETNFYKEKLRNRNYMLPVTGVVAEYVNAGDIQKILFMELIYDDEIVLLYRIKTLGNGELSGYFQTKNQTFYSIYEGTTHSEWHYKLENFILENYMIMTCEYDIDRKKNYAIQQVEVLDNTFHYPYQPLVKYTYKSRQLKKGSEREKIQRYIKEKYQEEICNRSGYIRKLPKNQKASDEARQYAAELGLSLPEGKTFVRAHEFHVYRKICSK